MQEIVWGRPVATGVVQKSEFDAAGRVRVLVDGQWWTLATRTFFTHADVYTVYQGDFGCHLVLKQIEPPSQSNLGTVPMTFEEIQAGLQHIEHTASPDIFFELHLGEVDLGPDPGDQDGVDLKVKTEAVRVDVVFAIAVGACDLYRVRAMVMDGKTPRAILYEGPWGSRSQAEQELDDFKHGRRHLR